MSVTVMRVEDVLKLDDNHAAQVPSSIHKNFFEHFGTTTCALGCEIKILFEAHLKLKKDDILLRARNDAKLFEHPTGKNLRCGDHDSPTGSLQDQNTTAINHAWYSSKF